MLLVLRRFVMIVGIQMVVVFGAWFGHFVDRDGRCRRWRGGGCRSLPCIDTTAMVSEGYSLTPLTAMRSCCSELVLVTVTNVVHSTRLLREQESVSRAFGVLRAAVCGFSCSGFHVSR